MAGFRKKIVVFFITVLLGTVVLIVCSAQSSTNGTDPDQAMPDPGPSRAENESKDKQFFADDNGFFDKQDYNVDGREFSVRAIIAVIFVLALFIAAIYVSKKFLPRITNLPGREIRIVETVHLGPRKAVHILEINNRRFLIGSTNENVTKLAELGSNLADLSGKEANFN